MLILNIPVILAIIFIIADASSVKQHAMESSKSEKNAEIDSKLFDNEISRLTLAKDILSIVLAIENLEASTGYKIKPENTMSMETHKRNVCGAQSGKFYLDIFSHFLFIQSFKFFLRKTTIQMDVLVIEAVPSKFLTFN